MKHNNSTQNKPHNLITFTIFTITLLLLTTSPILANNPTPFPEADNQALWPGEGPIRVFGWMTDNRNNFWARRDNDQQAIVFVGDSLFGNWTDIQAAFPYRKIANRGIGGDVTRGTLFRLKEDVLDLNPKAIFLLIGTNDLSAHADTKGIINNITKIITQIKAHNYSLPVVICTIPPRNSLEAPTKPGAVIDINTKITDMVKNQKNISLIDLYKELANTDGSPDKQYFTSDQLHLNPKGYKKLTSLCQPVINNLLGTINWIDPETNTLTTKPHRPASSKLPQPASKRVPNGYQLVFSDEFNNNTINKNKWYHRYIYENATLDHLNDEIGQRVDSALSITDNALTITATPRQDNKWNTGLCRSKWTFKYGYIESAAKFPDNRGAWPSFWLNSGVQYYDGSFSKLNWPPEIDIFEMVNNDREGPMTVTSFLHGTKAKGKRTFSLLDEWGNYRPGYSFADNKWHIFACLWTPTEVTTFVDGIKIVSHKYKWLYNDGTEAVPAHILLDMAVGGNWPGNPTTKDPMKLQFDYIRVYQHKP